MNQKEEIKAEKKAVNEAIKLGLNNYDGIFSEVNLAHCDLPKLRLINNRMIEDIFNDKKEKFYNKEFSKLETELKQAALKIGRRPFECQYEYLSKNDTLLKNKHFTKEQTLLAYRNIISELYTENKAA